MKFLIFLSPLILASCMTVRKVNFNGEELYEVSCNGTARTYSDCLSKSSEHCAAMGKKSAPISQDGATTIRPTGGGGFAMGIGRSMMFRCE